MKSNLFYSLPVCMFRRGSFQLVYGLILLGLWLYWYFAYQEPPIEMPGILSHVAVFTEWVPKISLVLGLFLVIFSIFQAKRFRTNVLAHRADFERMLAHKETVVSSDDRSLFNLKAMMMAYEYELERSFYDSNAWRDQLLMLTFAILKMACFVLVMMIASNLVTDQLLPGVAVGIACLIPWLMLGTQRPRNVFVKRAERAANVAFDELSTS